jgi:hypothetical protein
MNAIHNVDNTNNCTTTIITMEISRINNNKQKHKVVPVQAMKASGEVGCFEEEITFVPALKIEIRLLGRSAPRSAAVKPTPLSTTTTTNNNNNNNNNNS